MFWSPLFVPDQLVDVENKMPPKKRKPEDGTEPKPKRGRPKKDAKNGSGDSAGVDTDKEIETYDYEADGGTSEVVRDKQCYLRS